ncbi:hypothetical protein NDU88_001397 [Pleurodeles waltl]|uniref:Uncharacterized protein n=1 Tax=Pleurodeles waltl TaxID=8319 RepID=A0AAV7R8G0_PLEWA|nr:hypothetical protein NDU88_001397 [Pleurodeles waltl]
MRRAFAKQRGSLTEGGGVFKPVRREQGRVAHKSEGWTQCRGGEQLAEEQFFPEIPDVHGAEERTQCGGAKPPAEEPERERGKRRDEASGPATL